MQTLHTTKDGKQMLIAEMEDRHLMNVIKSFCRQIEEQAIIALGQFKPQDEMLSLFVNQASPEHQRQIAKNKIAELYNRLHPYVFEASLRNIDCSRPLQKAFRRKDRVNTSLTSANKPLQLDAAMDEDEDY